MSIAAAIKFGPYIALAALLGLFLWGRIDAAKVRGQLEVSQQQVETLSAVNASNKKIFEQLSVIQQQNAAIAEQVSQDKQAVNTRVEHTNTVIREAINNDPQTRDWASVPIPGKLRDQLNSPGNNPVSGGPTGPVPGPAVRH